MRTPQANINAVEQSTYVVTVSFTDELNEAVVPNNVSYTLLDSGNNVMNSLEQVSVSPASEVDIVLSGDDLSLAEGVGNIRYLLIEAAYNSTFGSDLPFKKQLQFEILDLRHVGGS